MSTMRLKIKRLPGCVQLPQYQTDGSAGMDVYAAKPTDDHPWVRLGRDAGGFIPVDGPALIWPGQRLVVPIGCAFAVPGRYELQVRPRSGLARKRGLTVANSPGTIDSDYRGPVAVVLINHGAESVAIAPGDRIAQLVMAPVVRARLHEVDVLPSTQRGSGGFGSTGEGL